MWQVQCQNYIICREKVKQGLKRLFPLLLDQCDDVLKANLWNRSNFKTIEDGGSVLKLIDAIKEEGYGLCLIKYPLVLYHRERLKS